MKSCAKHVHQPPMDPSVAGDESVALHHLLIHAEIGAAMLDQLVHLLERAFVEQQIDAFARRQLALLMLPPHALFTAARLGISMASAHLCQPVCRHKNPLQ